VNLTSAGTWRAPVHELIPVGPLKVAVRLPVGINGRNARSLVSEDRLAPEVREGWAHFEIPSILDHTVVVIG
jgi:hypothetical protein